MTHQPIEVDSYLGLIEVLRRRLEELDIIYDRVDKVGGLPNGYAAKLLASWPSRAMGVNSFFPVLTTLGLRLQLVPDDTLVGRLSQRSDWYRGRRGARVIDHASAAARELYGQMVEVWITREV